MLNVGGQDFLQFFNLPVIIFYSTVFSLEYPSSMRKVSKLSLPCRRNPYPADRLANAVNGRP